jgi:hypothetical protein
VVADQVVEAVSAGRRFLQQVRIDELVDLPARVARTGVEQRGHRVRVQLRARVQPEQPIAPPHRRVEVLIGRLQRGGDAAMARL